MICKSGGRVDQWQSAIGRCLADLITKHTGTKVSIETNRPKVFLESPNLVHRRKVLAWTGSTCCIDTAIVTPFSSSAGLILTASGRQGFTAKRVEKSKFDRYPHINLVPFVPETTGRPGYHTQKFIKALYLDTDHRPTVTSDTWAAIQTTLHNSISKQQLRAVTS